MENNNSLKIIDVDEPERLAGGPTKVAILLENRLKFREYLIKKIELRHYIIPKNDNGASLITAFVDTDKGSIEITYDKDSRYETLEAAQKFLLEQLGLSSLILRCIITLESELSKN